MECPCAFRGICRGQDPPLWAFASTWWLLLVEGCAMVVKHDLAEDRGVELIPLLEGEVAIASVRELGVVKSDDVAGGGQIDLGGLGFRVLHGFNTISYFW